MNLKKAKKVKKVVVALLYTAAVIIGLTASAYQPEGWGWFFILAVFLIMIANTVPENWLRNFTHRYKAVGEQDPTTNQSHRHAKR